MASWCRWPKQHSSWATGDGRHGQQVWAHITAGKARMQSSRGTQRCAAAGSWRPPAHLLRMQAPWRTLECRRHGRTPGSRPRAGAARPQADEGGSKQAGWRCALWHSVRPCVVTGRAGVRCASRPPGQCKGAACVQCGCRPCRGACTGCTGRSLCGWRWRRRGQQLCVAADIRSRRE